MKRLLVLLLGFIILSVGLTSCDCGESQSSRASKSYHYLNKEFILEDRKEVIDDGEITRIWEVRGTDTYYDSVLVGTIESTDCGCGSNKFIITDDLWLDKKIGDKLFFEYIGKFRLKYEKVNGGELRHITETSSRSEQKKDYTYTEDYKTSTTTINLNELEKERKILELEREMMLLEREKNAIKDSK